jgi:hypothetical protein
LVLLPSPVHSMIVMQRELSALQVVRQFPYGMAMLI